MKTQSVISGLAVAFLILHSPVLAVERLVPSQYSTIQAAIDDCNNGDVVIAEPNIYTGPGNRDIDFKGLAITVRSTNPEDPCVVAATVIDCNGSSSEPHRGFYFNSGEDANSVLAGLTITKGYLNTGGGIYCTSNPTIRHCIIKDNHASDWGGGMYSYGGSPTVSNCVFSQNSATVGGGMIAGQSSCAVKNCVFTENTADEGAGLFVHGSSSPTMRNCLFTGNVANYNGGAIGNLDSGPTIIGCTVSGNSANKGGG